MASAALNSSVTERFVAIGEVGLAGELRRVPGTDRRLAEAARLGFTEAVVPAESRSPSDRMTSTRYGMRIHSAATVVQALSALGLVPGTGRAASPSDADRDYGRSSEGAGHQAKTIPFPGVDRGRQG